MIVFFRVRAIAAEAGARVPGRSIGRTSGRGGGVTEPEAGGAAPRARLDGGPFLTPYEMAFGEAGFESRVFPRIQAEADDHGEDPTLRERFGFLTLAGD